MTRRNLEAERFVAARWVDLRRWALLVTGAGDQVDRHHKDPGGDESRPGRAEAITVLAEALDHWRRIRHEGAPAAALESAYLRQLVGPTGPRGSLPGTVTGGRPEPADSVEDCWGHLHRHERAAYLLVNADGHTTAEAASILGWAPEAAHTVVADVTARLEQAHLPAGQTTLWPPQPLADAVKQAWEHRLWSGPPWGDPLPEVMSRRAAIARRRILTVAGVGAAVVGAGAVAAIATRAQAPSPRPVTPTLPTSIMTMGATPLRWPPRGPLAGDPRTAAAVELRLPSRCQLLWAGDLGDRRFVLVEGGDNSSGQSFLLTGPAGTPISDLTLEPLWIDPLKVPALFALTVTLEGQDATLIALSQPGESRMQWSGVVSIESDASLTRTWQDLDLVDGFAVLPGLPATLPALLVRCSQGPGMRLSLAGPQQVEEAVCLECPGPDDLRPQLGAARADILAATGLTASEVSVTLDLAAQLDPQVAIDYLALTVDESGVTRTASPPPIDRISAYLARFHLPSGAILQSVAMSSSNQAERQPWPWDFLVDLEPVPATDLRRLVPVLALETRRGLPVLVPEGSGIVAVGLAARSWEPSGPWAPLGAPAPVVGSAAYVLDSFRTMTVFLNRSLMLLQGFDATGAIVDERLVSPPRTWVGPYDTLRTVENAPTLDQDASGAATDR